MFFEKAYGVGKRNNDRRNRESTEVAVPEPPDQLVRNESAPALLESRGNITLTQTHTHEKGDHTFRNVLLFLILACLVIFAVDLYKEMHEQRIRLQTKRRRCHNEYQQNQCDNPVDAIREQCHELQVCFKTDSEMALKTSQSAARLIGRLVGAFLKETGIWGAMFLLLLFSVFLIFICKISRTVESKQMSLKKQ